MSVEDPRFSAISEVNSSENFSSEVQEEIALSSNPSPIEEEIQVAQAGDGRTPTTGRVPTDPRAPASSLTPDANNVVQLPASVSIDDIRVDGANLILVQADGTEVVIVNGAAKIPTFLIGEVEVPQQTLFAALADSGINVAAGPDGSYTTGGRPDSSGADFQDTIQQDPGTPIELASLLGDTEFGTGGPFDGQLTADDQPTAFAMATAFSLSESVLTDGDVFNNTITGALGFDGGNDAGRISAVNNVNQNLTSGGNAVTVTTSPDGLTVTGTITVNGVETTVFTLKVTDPGTGAFSFTQSQPLDHATPGPGDADEILHLNFTFMVTDNDGDNAPNAGTFTIDIVDDVPVANAGTEASVEDEAVNGGNNEADGLGASVSAISLNIQWGADNANAGGTNDRSVAFTNATVVVADAYGATLTSLGQAVSTTILTDGTLVGYTGTVAPTSTSGEGAGNLVFFAKVSDANNGEYSFTLVKPLDHDNTPANAENPLSLTFNYTATDSDGDTSTNTFKVNIIDDVPVANAGTEATVEDEAVNGGNNEADGLSASVSGISLNIQWGADNANAGGTNDRSVAFTNATVVVADAYGATLTSLGQAVSTTILTDGTLVGYTGTVAPTSTSGEGAGNLVFFAKVSDVNNGEYSFTLVKPLDHDNTPANAENPLSLTFNYTATDSDGDTSANTFKVNIIDDVPVANAGTEATVEDEAVNGGNNEADGLGASVSAISLNIQWGADNANAGGTNDRSVAFTNATVVVADAYGATLTSLGQAVSTTILTDGTLVGYTGTVAPTSTSGEGAGNLVFFAKVSDVNNGEYSFTLVKPLDHDNTPANAENPLSLTFNYTATDSDGDTSASTFKVNIIDDVPVANAGTEATVEDEAVNGGNNEADGLGASVSAISLNIQWGADNANAGGTNDRSVAFTNATVVVADAYGATLTSLGQAVSTTILTDGTLVGYTGTVAPTSTSGEGAGNLVFFAKVSDVNNGEYSFTLVKPLDHDNTPANAENPLSLTFNYTATDSDGDTSASTFKVNIIDDVPVANAGTEATVEDESVNGGNNEADGLGASVSGISLNIQWGADNANAGGTNDRSVAFTNATVVVADAYGATLTSLGQAVSTTILTDGTLVGYTGTVAPTSTSGEGAGNLVFFAKVSDVNNGEYSFTLVKPLDHDNTPANAENPLSLTFNYTATDSDGDTSASTFKVNIIDDVPVANAGTEATVEDESVNGGNNEADGLGASVSGISLNIQWGADNANAGGTNDRSVAFTNATVVVADAYGATLTSLGQAVSTTILTDGTLVGYTGTVAPTSTSSEGAGNLVFFAKVSDVNNGEYSFTLVKPLDHDNTPANAENPLSLTFNYTATDSDGDTSANTFKVNIIDDVPTVGKPVQLPALHEDDLPRGNDLTKETLISSAELGISWGSDNAKVGDKDALLHRTLSFRGLAPAIAGLTADGYALELGDVTTLANGGETVTVYNTHGDAIFTITLDPTTNGGNATFELIGNLDHRIEGADVDQLTISFGFTATDSDGDTVDGDFTININDDAPVQGEATGISLSEDDISIDDATDGTPAADRTKTDVTSLGISWGADDDIRGTGDTFGRSVHFATSAGNVVAASYTDAATAGISIVGGSLSSGGVALVYVVTDTEDGGQILTAHKGSADGATIFEVVLDSTSANGSYTFELKGELDHDSTSDNIQVSFSFRGTDADGDNAERATFTVQIADDQPVQGTVGTNAGLNEDDVSTYAATDGTPAADKTKTDVTSLGISWGADDDIRGAGDTFGRTVSFASASGTLASAGTNLSASALGLTISGGTLTSGGDALTYTLMANDNGGQTLTAYIQGTATKAFEIVIDPTSAHGSYTVEVFNEIDHSEGSNSATISFNFRATDADGDNADLGTASVTILDDQLIVGNPQSGDVDEDGYPQLVSGAGNPGPLLGAGDSFLVDTVTTRNLNISWGADDANDNPNGGYLNSQVAGDRSVVFGANSAPAGLTSNGFSVVYEVSANGTELVAYRYEGVPNQGGHYVGANGENLGLVKTGAAVFTVTLSDEGTGTYRFTLLDNIDQARGNEENNTNLNFEFVARDADGDQVTKIFSVSLDDDTPVLSLIPSSGSVAEGNIGTVSGAIVKSLDIFWGADQGNSKADFGYSTADGDRYVVFNGNSAPNGLTSNGHAIRYETSANGTLLTAYRYENGHYVDTDGNATNVASKAAVFTIGLSDQGTGSFTFTLIDNLDHDGFLQGNTITLGFGFKAVDGDGDGVNGSFYVSINDETPSLTSVAGSSVDEDGLFGGNDGETYTGQNDIKTDIAGKDTTTGAVSLGIRWGADADLKSERLNNIFTDDPIGREVAFVRANGNQVLEIGTGKIADGNVANYLGQAFADLRSDGVALDYRIDYTRDTSNNWNGGYVLTAYKDNNTSDVVFKVTLDPTVAGGTYKFDLIGNLDHSVANAEDDLSLTFNFRATDSDGDSTGRGSFVVTVNDDAPIAQISINSTNTLLGDETANFQSGTDDQIGSLPNAFAAAAHPSLSGLTVLGWSQQADMVSMTGNSYGADGAGSQSLALTTSTGGSFDGNQDSGLTTLSNIAIKLYTDGNIVLGKAGSTVVFALSIDGNGTVSMVQYQPIKHADATNPNETASLNGIYVTTTISDREGDTTKATTGGQLDIKVRDDAPTVAPTQTGVTVDEDGLSTGNHDYPAYAVGATTGPRSVSANLSYSFGTDGAAGENTNIVFQANNLQSLGLKSFGINLVYGWNDNTNTLTATAGNGGAVVFTLKVTDVATGAYTFTLERPLDHNTSISANGGANKEDDINIDFGFTIRDGDGDPASGIVRVTINDDAPHIGSPEAESVSEVNLPYTWIGQGNDESNADTLNSVVKRGDLAIHWGADNRDALIGPDISVRFGANTVPAGLTSDGDAVKYSVSSSGTVLTAYTGSPLLPHIVFTVSLDDNGTGEYTFRLYDNIDHTGNDKDSKTLSFNFIAEDSDNDEASGSFSVTIVDGGPSIGNNVENESVNENNLPYGAGDELLADTNFSTVQRGDLKIDWGADDNNSGSADRSVTFSAALNGFNSGLTHDGVAIIYTLSSGGTELTAKAGSTTVFTVSLSDSGDGTYTFKLFDNIDHTDLNDASVTLNFGFTAKDSDGDTATSSFDVNIIDDTPEAGTPDRQTLEERSGSPAVSNVSLNIDWKSDDNNSGTANRSVTFSNLNTPAANVVNAASQQLVLTSNGQTLSYALVAGVLVGYINANPAIAANKVFEVTLNDDGSGSYTFTLHQPLDHDAPGNDDAYLDLRFLYTATDSDGDGSNASFTVRVDEAGNVTNGGDNISYDALNSGVVVNLSESAATVNAEPSVAANTATDLAGVLDKVIGIDKMDGVINVTGGSGNDILIGGNEANTIRGGAGNDIIIGNGGNDTLEGGDGNDLFIHKVGDGNDRINGGDETSTTFPNYDVLRIDGDSTARTYTIGRITSGQEIGSSNSTDISVGYTGPSQTTIRADDIEGIDIVAGSGALTVNIGNLNGTTVLPGTIHITGSNSATGDVVDASGILGGGTDNRVSVVFDGNEGNDTFIGGGGNDVARGGSGNDTLTGGLGADTIEGGAGNDAINLYADGTYASGTLRSVTLTDGKTISVNIAGKASNLDSIDGGADSDTIYFRTGTKGLVLDGNVTAINGIERIVGSEGDDLIVLKSDYTQSDFTYIEGGVGNDTIVGGASNDVLDGGLGDDTLAGGGGADILKGGAGNDALWGGKHADSLYGNATSNAGVDLLATAGESDSANYASNFDKYRVFFDSAAAGGKGIWRVQALSGAAEYVNSNAEVNTDNLYGIELIKFSNGVVLDLTDPVRVFNGTDLIGTYDTIQLANNAVSTLEGYRIELPGTVIGQTATITKNDLTVVGGAEDTGIVLTLDGVAKITLDGEAPIKVIGDGGDNTIIGNDGANVLQGGNGSDTISGGDRNDVLEGGAGNDILRGDDGADTLKGGVGNDELWGGKHADSLFGNDTSNAGADLLPTSNETDSANYSGVSTSYRVFFDTVAASGIGLWRVQALAGAPEYTGTHVDVDTDNLYGIELIKFSNNVVLDLTDPVRVFNGTDLIGTYDTIQAANDADSTLAGYRIELVGEVKNQSATIDKEGLTVVGGAEDTGIVLTLTGDARNITLGGQAPIDAIGNDFGNAVQGNDGGNEITGNSGGDALRGGAGNDTFYLGADLSDASPYGPRNMLLGNGSTLSVPLTNMVGSSDLVEGGSGYDKVVLTAEGTKGFVLDALDSTSQAFSGIEEIVGTAGADLILLKSNYMSDVPDGGIRIDGGAGDDHIGGGAGKDTLLGGDGDDVVAGLDGDDTIRGGNNNDTLWGGAGNDTIYGDDGLDNITGGLGNDTIFGGAGGDIINYTVGDGLDMVDGGAGSDLLIVNGNTGDEKSIVTLTSTGFTVDVDGDGTADINVTNVESVIFSQGEGADKLTVRGLETAQTMTLEGDAYRLWVYGSGVPSISGLHTEKLVIEGKGGDDTINASLLNVNGPQVLLTLDGGDGNDTIIGSAGADTILGGDGDDTLSGGKGTDILDGGAGVDTASYAGDNGGVYVQLGSGWATSRAAADAVDNNYANLQAGVNDGTIEHDTFVSIENITGTDYADIINGDGGKNVIKGGGGADYIIGGAGNDSLYGEAGNDVLVGGKGDDLLDGGAGNDTFNYTRGDGSDTIDGGGDIDTLTISKGTAVAGVHETRIGGTASGVEIQINDNIVDVSPGDALLAAIGVEKLDVQIGDYETAVIGTSGHGNLVGVTNVKVTGSDQGNVLSSAYLTSDTSLTANLAGGDDLFIAGNQAPAAVVDGGAGIDTVNYNQLSAPRVQIDLQAGIVNRISNATNQPIAQDLITNFENAEGTINNDTLRGTNGANILVGNAGDDIIEGRGGNDVLFGGSGNDTFVYKVGDGNDIIDGGAETGTSNPNYDVLKIDGDATARSYTIGKSTLADAGNIVAAYDRADVLVTYSGTADGATIRADEIERIEINLGAGAGSITIGDVSNTAIEPSTIVINGGTGNDTIDLTQLLGTKVVINDIDGIGGDTDTVKLAGKWADYDITESNGTFIISRDNHVVAVTTNVEQFIFTDESGNGTVTAEQLLNDAPLAAADSKSVVEAGGVANGDAGSPSATGNVLDNDTDADSGNFDTKHVTAVKLSGGSVTTAVPESNDDVIVAGKYGTLTIHRDGSYGYALDNTKAETQGLAQGAAAADVFTYTMTDAHGETSTADLTINITGTNDAPVIDPISAFTIAEDTIWSVSEAVIEEFITNHVADADVSATPLTYQVFVNGLPASDVFTATSIPAEISYTPTANFNGQLNAMLVVFDGIATTTREFVINVTPVNDAPVAVADSYSTDEDTALVVNTASGILANDGDVDLNPITAVLVSGPTHGSLSLNPDGSFTYTPAANYDGTDSFTYKANDGVADSDAVTVNLNVIARNDAPTAVADSYSINEDGSLVVGSGAGVLVNDTDVDSNTLTAVLVSGPAHGTLTLNNDGSFTYTPTGNYSGPDSFVYKASDGTELSDAVTVTINVTSVNDSPVISNVSADDSNFYFTITDPDSDSLTLTAPFAEVYGNPTLSPANWQASVSERNSITSGTFAVKDEGGLSADVLDLFLGTSSANTIAVSGSKSSAIYGFAGADKLTGGTGADWIFGGDGNDTINGASNDKILHGGAGTDTLNVAGGFVNASDAQIDQIEKVIMTSSGILNLSNQTEDFDIVGFSSADTITGGSGNDVIDGGNGNDILIGGGGADTLTGGNGNDIFRFTLGSSSVTALNLGERNSSASISGYDTIIGFTSGSDKIDLPVSPVAVSNTGATRVDGQNAVAYTGNGNSTVTISHHSITNGIITFYSLPSGGNAINIDTEARLAAAVKYLENNNLGTSGATVAFVADVLGNSSSNDVFIYQQVGAAPDAQNDLLVGLADSTINNLNTLIGNSAVDPIILDLDHNGFAFTSVSDGVQFDINADGHKDQVAWTKTDGILAYDVDGNGKIDNGSEIFTPAFAGGTHAGGVAALATLDINHDGKIDASDTGFDKLLVWKDANGDGVSDEGELKGLHDYGITGISLDAHSMDGYLDGQALFAEGTFTRADGSIGSFVEVGFDTVFGDRPDHVLFGTDGDDILAALPGFTEMTGGKGADTFVLNPSALQDLDVADVITDYSSKEGDSVDVSRLLDSLLGEDRSAQDSAAHVRTTVAGNDTNVSVQVAADTWKDVAVLQNHTEAVKILFDDQKHGTDISHV